MRVWCRHTRGRFESTHGGRFERTHALSLLPQHTTPVQLTKKHPHRVFDLVTEVHQRNERILPIFSLRIGREQHVPDSSNHLLCLIKLFSFSNLEEIFGGNQPDGSICLSPSPPSPPPHHNNNTTQHTETDTERDRERRQRKERDRKRRCPSQACFTIFRVLTSVSHSLSRSRYQFLYIYVFTFS